MHLYGVQFEKGCQYFLNINYISVEVKWLDLTKFNKFHNKNP